VCIGLLPIGALYVFSRPQRPARAWVALLPLAAVVGAWCLQNRLAHGAVHLAASASHYADYYEGRYWTGADAGRRAISDVAALGGTALPIAVLVAATARASARLAPYAAAAAAAVVWLNPLGLTELREYGPGQKAALALVLGAGLFLLAEAARRGGPARSDRGFLLFWAAGALLGTVVTLPFGAARYMILVLPPLFLLLCAAGPDGPPPEWSRRRRGTRLALGCTLALSLVLATSDHEYAGVYRDFARRVPALAGDKRVWFIGDWGFRHYMEKAGHRYLLSTDETPAADDFIVRPRVAGLHEMAPGLAARIRRVATIAMPGVLPVRVMSFEAKAGYYSHGWGLLPFAVSRAPLERFDVFRVIAPPP
jgi:hypothetical protein